MVDEQEFKDKFLPETQLQDVAVNFISVEKIEAKQVEKDFEKLDQEFPSVEGLITTMFPQLIANESGEVGLALNCVNEINLKPGTKPVKQRIR